MKCSLRQIVLACVAVLAGQTAAPLNADPMALTPSTSVIPDPYRPWIQYGTGTVSDGHEVFSFDALAGSIYYDIQVTVTSFSGGSLYNDDDSSLFIFDSDGLEIAFNDDYGSSLQSRIPYFYAPASGRYFAAVTTFPNEPILDSAGYISGWYDDGGANIDFTLTIAAVPEPVSVILLGTVLLLLLARAKLLMRSAFKLH